MWGEEVRGGKQKSKRAPQPTSWRLGSAERDSSKAEERTNHVGRKHDRYRKDHGAQDR